MIIHNSLILAIFGIASVLLGLIRDRLLSLYVGVSPMLDVYTASFRLPDILYSLSLAFVTAGTVVPFLTVEGKDGASIDARHRLSSISLFFAGTVSIIGAVIALTIPLYAHMIVPGFSQEQLLVFIDVTRILMIQPLILGVASLISCFAQMNNHFVLYGIAPLGYSLGIMYGITFLFPHYGIHGLVYGVILGALLSLSIQMWSLRRTRFIEVLPYFSWRHIRELVHMALPRTGVNILTQVRSTFFTAFATLLGPGVLSSYMFAQKITEAVTQVIQQSVTTASLPILSREYTESRFGEYQHAVKVSVVTLGVLGSIIGLIIYLYRDVVIQLAYGTTNASETISFLLTGFLIALPLQMMIGYFSISLYSAKDTKSVFYSNMIATLFAVGVCYFTKEDGLIALVYGVITMSIANFLLISLLYSRKKLH